MNLRIGRCDLVATEAKISVAYETDNFVAFKRFSNRYTAIAFMIYRALFFV